MKKLVIAALACLFAATFAGGALAAKVPNETPPNPSDNPGQCPTTGYKFLRSPELFLSVPDGTPVGVTTPPLQLPPDGSTILDVVMDMEFEHTWIGDMNIKLFYDHDCSVATPPFGPVSVLCRQQLAGCPVDGCCGCSGDMFLGGRFVFGTNGATKEIAADAQGCPSVIPYGCYRPAVESQFTFSVFSGLRKDGCWYLDLQDGAGADEGLLANWQINVANQQTTAVESSTWGAVKAGYLQ
jgi:hypothetical protein